MLALVRALGDHGGFATPREVYRWIAANTDLVEHLPLQTKESKDVHFEREIRFARQEMADADLLATRSGVWHLLDSSLVDFTPETARQITKENTRRRRARRNPDEAPNRPAETGRRSIDPAPTTGPRPFAGEILMQRCIGPAATYALRFEGSNIWKIGYSSDVGVRLREINQHVPVELLNRRWLLVRTAQWPSADVAHAMEQRVLAQLHDRRTVYERLECDEDALFVAWAEALDAFR